MLSLHPKLVSMVSMTRHVTTRNALNGCTRRFALQAVLLLSAPAVVIANESWTRTTPQSERVRTEGWHWAALETPQTGALADEQETLDSGPPAEASDPQIDDSAALRADLARVRTAVENRASELRLSVSQYYDYINQSETDFAAFALAVEHVLGVAIVESLHTAEKVANAHRGVARKVLRTHGPDSSIPTNRNLNAEQLTVGSTTRSGIGIT